MADQIEIQVTDLHPRESHILRGPWDGTVTIGAKTLKFYIVSALDQVIRDATCIHWIDSISGVAYRYLDIAKGKILETLEARNG